MTSTVGATLTVGVSITIPEPHAMQLRRWREMIGDPQALLVKPHITLAPPTPMTHDGFSETLTLLQRMSARRTAFAIHLRGTGTFRPVSPVVFVAVAQGISECEMVADEIRSGPLARDLEFPYHPHVTVAHNVPDDMLDRAYEGLASYDARFVADRVMVHTQEPDGNWLAVREFPLLEA